MKGIGMEINAFNITLICPLVSQLVSQLIQTDEAFMVDGRKNTNTYQTTNLLKIWFLFLVSMKGQKRDKSEFATKFVGIIVTLIFI